MVQKDPGFIVGPIARFMGWIIDFIFNGVYSFTEKNSLGISIIFLTFIIRFLMLPLAFKSHKSMLAMQKLTPEIEKIKKKYGDSKDTETQQKMNAEMQTLYAKNKVSPFGGCLPLLVQMPIFFALTYLMNQSFLYITKLKAVYENLAINISQLADKIHIPDDFPQWARELGVLGNAHVPKNLHPFQFIAPEFVPETKKTVEGVTAEIAQLNLVKLLKSLSPDEWTAFLNDTVKKLATPEQFEQITSFYQKKLDIEVFFGLNMLNNAGWSFPGIIIPILTVITTFLTSWLSMKMTAQTNKDNNAVTQQRVMMFFMPLLMGFFTVNYPIGVGIYWITSSVFQVVQQAYLNKKYSVNLSVAEEDKKKHVRKH